jgi:hypothetical protein
MLHIVKAHYYSIKKWRNCVYLKKWDDYYILEPFNFGFDEAADLFEGILMEDEFVLFGFKFYDFDINKLDELLDGNLKKTYESLLETGLVDTTISTEEEESTLRQKEEFFAKRKVFTNNEWLMKYVPKLRREPKTTWIRPGSREEMIKILKMTTIDHQFMCVLINNERDFNTYRLGIKLVEGDENNEQIFTENKKGTFENDVLPRLRRLFPNIEHTQ